MNDKVMRRWFAADVTVRTDAVEAVESAFNVLGALGTEADSLRKAKDEPQTVSGFFDDRPDEDEVRRAVSESLDIYSIEPEALVSVTIRTVEEADWLAEWKKHWKPTEIGRFVVAPPWVNVASGKILIKIEPNMAFGTGTHDTTQLCLRAISERYKPDQTFLDVGTGTGILAIAAAKLGGRTIYGCDTDVDSVSIARENSITNEADLIEFSIGPLEADSPVYDFVCANLTIDVIVPILDLLLAKAGSSLLLSGILKEQEPIILEELGKRGIKEPEIAQSGEWISVLIEKDPGEGSK